MKNQFNSENLIISGMILKEIQSIESFNIEQSSLQAAELLHIHIEKKSPFSTELNQSINSLRELEFYIENGYKESKRGGVACPIKETESKIIEIKTRQHKWDGKIIYGVKYSMQEIQGPYGLKIRGVFPEFNCLVEYKLDEKCMSDAFWEKYGKNSSNQQMIEATKLLKQDILEKPYLVKQYGFTELQIQEIMNENRNITGYTWHHDPNWLVMKLVECETHSLQLHPHAGGMAIWNIKWVQANVLKQIKNIFNK